MTETPDSVPVKAKSNIPFVVRPCPPGTRFFYRASQQILRIGFKLWFRLEVEGRENMPTEGGVMVLVNHNSFLDPPLVGASLPRESGYLARESLFRVPILGWLIKTYNTFPIRRGASDREALKSCKKLLDAGWPLMFFPEGTRSHDGALGEIKPGYLMVLDGLEGVPFLPVAIDGAWQSMNRRMAWPRPRKIRIRIGKPAVLPPKRVDEKKRDYYERCVEDLRTRFIELGAQTEPDPSCKQTAE